MCVRACVCVCALLTHAPFVLDEGPERHHSFQLHKTQCNINHTKHTSLPHRWDTPPPHLHEAPLHVSQCLAHTDMYPTRGAVDSGFVTLTICVLQRGGEGEGGGGEKRRGEKGMLWEGRGGEMQKDIGFCCSFSPPPCLCLLTTHPPHLITRRLWLVRALLCNERLQLSGLDVQSCQLF